MGLRDLNLKPAYDSDEDDVLNDFYIPALSESVRYRRLAGFFSSTALAVAARGIRNFILKGGEIELLVGARLSKNDVEAIKKGMTEPNRVLSESAIKDLSDIREEFVKDHVRALAWMVAKKRLAIKVVILLDEDGKPLNDRAVEDSGIFHQKVGVLIDANNDVVSFSGSINETGYGWLHNIEEFKTFKSWITGDQEHLQSDLHKFRKYWDGVPKNAIVIDVPTAIRDKLIEMAPASISDLNLERYEKKSTVASTSRRYLRDYQKNAVESWKTNDFRGILSMATGTGKTLVALRAIETHVPLNVLNVIVVPFQVLAKQWKEEVAKEFPTAFAIVCDANRPDWLQDMGVLKDYISKATDDARRSFVITTYHTARTERFGEVIDELPEEKLCIIADEVHHAGAPEFSKVLREKFRYRLGLSATPQRTWDEEGQQRIIDFFERVVFDYPIEAAIKERVLCEYEYHIMPAVLEADELDEYSQISASVSAKISRLMKLHPQLVGLSFPRLLFELSNLDLDAFAVIQGLILRRAGIMKKARRKSTALMQIIRQGDLGRCLIYCNDQDHLTDTLRILYDENISALRYDSSMSSDERQRNLDSFSRGFAEYLVAIKCLDEGVDIPICDSAILIASSKSAREFIQRRGRLLRLHPDKKLARIYDILVLPIDLDTSRTVSHLEFEILETEIRRARIFAIAAKNSADILLEISRIESALASRIRE